METTRRTFIQVGATAIAGGATVACGTSKDSSGGKDASPGKDAGKVADDASGHVHDATTLEDTGVRDAGPTDLGVTDAGAADPACSSDEPGVTITGNHGHSLSVSIADVAAGVEKTYAIQGGRTIRTTSRFRPRTRRARSGARVSIASTHVAHHSTVSRPVPLTFQIIIPITHAVDALVRRPRSSLEVRVRESPSRSGASGESPPIWMPMDPRLAKPQSAYDAITSERGCSSEGATPSSMMYA